MGVSKRLVRNNGIITGTVTCPYCKSEIPFIEGTNGTACVASISKGQRTRLTSGESYTEECIGLELIVKCDTCGYTSRSAGHIINEIE